MPKEKYLKLGDILVKEGFITPEQLKEALEIQRREGGRLGEILVKTGLIKEEVVVSTLGKQLGVPYFSLGTGMLKPAADQDLDKLVTKDFAIKNLVLPLSRTLNSLTCAMYDPLDLVLIDNLRKITGCEINPVIATKTDITKAIEDFYGKQTLKDVMVSSYDTAPDEELIEYSSDREELNLDVLIARAEEAPVVKITDLIIRQAINERASDIHIEPFEDKISLRYRIDGKLYEIPPPARHMHLPIISRIKIMAKLDIAEKRLPQDGGFLVKIEDRVVDIRVSTIPTIYGEKVVLRILDRKNVILDLNQLGFEVHQLEHIRKAINMPYGLILLTGPTGSGKTTTLYAILNEIKHPTKNIITIEDPVEYRLEGINQVQVKSEIGLTFATALRSFLRQDPDVILVGEIRDTETAEICIRAALTGHLVLSTLHTNNAPSAINRLKDIGIPTYIITPSLLMIVAQRLIRKLCPECKEAYEPSPQHLGGLKLNADLIYRPKGCSSCNYIGYKGRVCVAEVMVVSEKIRELITQQASYQLIKETCAQEGMQSFFQSALKKVEAGITSLEEALTISVGIE